MQSPMNHIGLVGAGGICVQVEPSMSLIADLEEFLDDPTLEPYSHNFRTPDLVCNDSL